MRLRWTQRLVQLIFDAMTTDDPLSAKPETKTANPFWLTVGIVAISRVANADPSE